MKRNKKNIVSSVDGATTQENRIAVSPENTELVMKDVNGKLIKAEGVKLSPAFMELSQRLMKEKGISKESAEAIAKSVTVWTPDMIVKDIDTEASKPEKKKRSPRKKATEETTELTPKSKKVAKKTRTTKSKKAVKE